MCSIVEYYGDYGKSSCGYCKGQNTSESTGMTAHMLSVEDYQDLIDRGWRRSGKYCYKPSNSSTCCPSYTIKCTLDEFVLSKSHKKILKTMNKFLRDGIRNKAEDKPESGDKTVSSSRDDQQRESISENEFLRASSRELPAVQKSKVDRVQEETPDASTQNGQPEKSLPDDRIKGIVREEGKNPKKKKQIRLERRQAKLTAKGLPVDEPKSQNTSDRKSLTDFLNEEPKDGKHKLKVTLIPSNSAPAKASYDLYKLYQMSVHRDKESHVKPESFQRFLCITPLKVQLVRSSTKQFKAIHGAKEFELFRIYQLHVHDDSVEGISHFYNFLVDSPLTDESDSNLGSFHQQYWLDDKLIAVAVIDILPKCLSSVYFFYDPAYGFLSLGTYSSLRELAFAQQLQREDVPDLRSYYMGFYIHSCPKMRYKARLSASYLLCPEVYTWHKITEALLKRLDETKYARFSEDPNAKDANAVSQEDLKRIHMFNNGDPIPFEQYLRKCKDTTTLFRRVHQYAQYVGKQCARRIVLYL